MIKKPIDRWNRISRMGLWFVISVVLLGFVAYARKEQIPVIVNKAALVTLGAWLGYWIDVFLFRRHLPPDAEATQQMARAILVGAIILAMSLGL